MTGVGASTEAADAGLTARSAAIALLLATLAGLLIRLWHIADASIWWDEGYTVWYARMLLDQMFREVLQQDVNPPLYYAMLHGWIRLFGDSEWAIRLPSAILGTLCIPLIYWLGALLLDRRMGLLAAGILALSGLHVQYAQEARTYALLICLSLLSMGLFVRLLRRPSAGLGAAYVVTTALLPYAHAYGALTIIVQNAWYILLLRVGPRPAVRPRRWLLTQGVVLILMAGAILYILHGMRTIQRGFWILPPTIWTLLEALVEYTGWGQLLSESAIDFIKRHRMMVLLVLAAVAAVSLPLMARWRARHASSSARWASFLLLWAGLTLLIPLFWSWLATPVFVGRYTMIVSCALYLLAAGGMAVLLRDRPRAGVIVLLFVGVVSILSIRAYYSASLKAPWRQAVAYLDQNARANDVLLFSRPQAMTLLHDYYTRRSDTLRRAVGDEITPLDQAMVQATLASVADRHRVWLVLHHDNDPHGLLRPALRRQFTEHPTPFAEPGWGITVLRYER